MLILFMVISNGLNIPEAKALLCFQNTGQCVDDDSDLTTWVNTNPEEEELIKGVATGQSRQLRGVQSKEGDTPAPEIPKSCGWLNFACMITIVLEYLLDGIVYIPFRLANFLFTYFVDLNNASFGGPGSRGLLIAGTIGWTVTRDVANMFFVFFLLWVAIATIFGFEQYGMRQILPKLIVVALLINFSLPISQLVINTSNSLANIFIQSLGAGGNLYKPFQQLGINPAATVKKIGTLDSSSLATGNPDKRVAAETLVKNTRVVTNSETGITYSYDPTNCSFWQRFLSGALCGGTAALKVSFDWGTAKINDTELGESWMWAVLRRMAVKILVYPVALFVIFAAVIMLLVRLLMLTFLVVLGPLAFLLMIMPQTQSYYGRWWDSLIKWSFFFPAFMFFFWLGVNVLNAVASGKGADYPDQFVSLFIGLGFLVGSLIVSQQLGVAVAGTALNMGKRWTTGARRWAVSRSVGRIKEGGKEALRTGGGRAFTEAMGKIPLVGGMVQRGLGRAEAAGAAAEKERLQRTYGFARRLPAEERSKYLMGLERKQKKDVLEAADGAERKKLVQGLSGADQKKLIDQLRGLGAEHLVANATNNPEVIVHAEHPEMQEGTLEYQRQVREETKRFADKGELSSEFMESRHFLEYLKEEGKMEDLQQIFASTNPKVREQMAGFLRDVYQGAEQEAARASEEARNKPGLPGETARKMAAGQTYKETYEKKLKESLSQDVLRYTSGSPQMRVIAGYGVPYERIQKKEKEKIDKEVDFFAEAIHRASFDIDEAIKVLDKYEEMEKQKIISRSSFADEAGRLPVNELREAIRTANTAAAFEPANKTFELLKKIYEEEKKKKK